jgi:stage IV sporulation protein FB
MLLFEPPPSPGDLHFRVFGIPVRVHPFFWLTTLLMGLNPRGGTPPAELMIWIGVVFVSVLVHELGHAFTQRYFGGRPWITLHAIGGLASCDDCDRRPTSQILISLAGPAAGFLLAALVVVVFRATGHEIGLQMGREFDFSKTTLTEARVLPLPLMMLYWEPLATPAASNIVGDLLSVNILWGLINLLPVYPLDGGRVAREVCTLGNPQRGIVMSLRISIVVGALMAAVAGLAWNSLYTAILFGYLAYSSYRTLDAYQRNVW